jgi:isochorismate synthase
MVRTAVTEIRSGDLSKVVVARAVRVSAPDTIDVFALLRHLRSIHRESFVFGVWQSDSAFVGASPERLVRVTGSEVEASSLAGTIERGATPSADADNAHLLRESTKDLAEHVAVRDELISALSERCDDVRAADTPSLLTLPNVHHLHTPIRARLRNGDSLLSLVGALHPTPAVGGLPRDVALEFIEDHEGLDRGWYAAPVGWIGGQSGEFAVALRSALVDGNHAVLYAGCGIVAESDPDLEYAESNLKLKAMLSAIAASASASPDHAAATAALEHSS